MLPLLSSISASSDSLPMVMACSIALALMYWPSFDQRSPSPGNSFTTALRFLPRFELVRAAVLLRQRKHVAAVGVSLCAMSVQRKSGLPSDPISSCSDVRTLRRL
jgi:hypothetical protein